MSSRCLKTKLNNEFMIFKIAKCKKPVRNFSGECDGSAGPPPKSFTPKPTTRPAKLITVENMNQNIKKMEYAVRGPLLIRASEIEKELKAGKAKPFATVVKANLGDAQAMGQQPLTFYRQVLALVSYPQLMSTDCFPEDAIERARVLLAECKGQSVGAYSESLGIELIRKDVAEFIKARDGFDSNWEDIILSGGASEGIKNVLKLMNFKENEKSPGVMVPIPQYPLYSATLAELDMTLIGYYLQEKSNWGLDKAELTRSYNEGKKTCNPRAIVVINPGNPTAQVLTRENIREIIKFAYENQLILMADEVYQANIYAENKQFHSFKKVMNELGKPYSEMEIVSFMSCSKGYMGECGIRGGCCEICNFDPEVKMHFAKSISSMLCPTVLGQCLLDCVVKPPQPGEPSHEVYECEKAEILDGLKTKGKIMHGFFNSLKGMSCNEVEGAMYAFPKLDLPAKAVEAAKAKNLAPDAFYAFELLENTGICVIPGTGFRQEPGTYHFRTTILPPIEHLKDLLETFKTFHKSFMEKFS